MKKTKSFVKFLENNLDFKIPNEQINHLAMIIDSIVIGAKVDTKERILIVAHGDEIASGIANVVNRLLSLNYVKGFNIPFDKNLNDILPAIIENLDDNHKNIIFVDLVSLLSLEQLIYKEKGIKVTVIPTINVMIVLEVTRRLIYLNQDVSNVLLETKRNILKLEQLIGKQIDKNLNIENKKIIYTTCKTNEGTAVFLKNHLTDIFQENDITDVEVNVLRNNSIAKMREFIEKTSNSADVLAIVGTIDLDMKNIPFISLNDILLGNGIDYLFSLVSLKQYEQKTNAAITLKRATAINTALIKI